MDFPGSVREVRSIEQHADGDKASIILFRRRGKKRKKSSWGLKAVEEAAHQAAKGQTTFANSYLSRHERSNEKKRDGWLIDLPTNVFKAARRGRKQARIERVYGF